MKVSWQTCKTEKWFEKALFALRKCKQSSTKLKGPEFFGLVQLVEDNPIRRSGNIAAHIMARCV